MDWCVLPLAPVALSVLIAKAVGMISDGLVVFLPMLLVWKLTRTLLEKMLLSILIGTGMLAMAAGVFKALTMQSFNLESDNIAGDMMPCYLWIRIEEICLIIGACAPLLKPPIESLLARRFGLPRFEPQAREFNSALTVPHSRGVRYFTWNQGSPVLSLSKDSGTLGSQSTPSSTPSDCEAEHRDRQEVKTGQRCHV